MKTTIKNILGNILGFVIFIIVVSAIAIGWRLLEDSGICNMDHLFGAIGLVVTALCGMYMWKVEREERD